MSDSTKDLAKKVFYFGVGVLAFTKEKAEQVVDELVKKGEVKQEEAAKMVDELAAQGKKEKESLKEIIDNEVAKVVKRLPVATKSDLQKLEDRIELLEKDIAAKSE